MIKAEVIEEFTLKDFDKLKNLVRAKKGTDEKGRLYVKDTFECDKEIADYLSGNNPLHKTVIKIIEIIPEVIQVVETEEAKEIATDFYKNLSKPKKAKKKK